MNHPVRPGDRFARRELRDLHDHAVPIPDPGSPLVHLQLRRYAGCPVCSLHLHAIAARHAEIVAAGIREVAVFHSGADALRRLHLELPFAVVPDPDRHLYAELGVGTSARTVLDPRAWPAMVRAAMVGASAAPTAGVTDGPLGRPADLLIAHDGRVVAAKYGVHADDQWSVDELLAHAAAVSP